ncbi:cysteine proteinase [Lindgomyces ingoldianus]|uniref:Cysteine proteinase n=1 Tax=Lindgomyces ingoldianus TaxID=673940 RepID=A0ACB6R8J3_9PLEO|nr:cysteine proteinase [Lindgomyces ingoldianus]KAF2475569.1 cysteine proteinase [Lindgomyces ingoldianus]
MDTPGHAETLEALQSRHRTEQRDLVARITQKKKSATKKTRKGVNEECSRLEQEMEERQAQELAVLNGDDPAEELVMHGEENLQEAADEAANDEAARTNGVEQAMKNVSLSSGQLKGAVQPQPQAQSQSQSQSESQSQNEPRKPNRAKARLARRAAEQEVLAAKAAEEAANMPNLREQERTRMQKHLEKHSLREKTIRADGHCLYAAIADQMETVGLGLKPKMQPSFIGEETFPPYKVVRYAAANFIEQNPDGFVPFMEEPFDDYLQKVRDTGEWGGHMELMALANTYGVNINVLHGDGRVDKIETGEKSAIEEGKEIWLGYYRHGFGLGEHYNSLRKAP